MMIWIGGAILPGEAVRVGVLDRTFEHGLGLFETFRTWRGRAPLLDRHLARMRGSAGALGLALDGGALPCHDDVAGLLAAEGRTGDALVRIVASGGVAGGDCQVWMRLGDLPLSASDSPVTLGTRLTVAHDNPLLRHKTLNYWERRIANERACAAGYFDALAVTVDGRVWETTRANLFAFRRGVLWTPETEGPLLPGVMRAAVIEVATELGMDVGYGDPPWGEAEAVFLTNSVRGIVQVAALEGMRYDAQCAHVADLVGALDAHLSAGELE